MANPTDIRNKQLLDILEKHFDLTGGNKNIFFNNVSCQWTRGNADPGGFIVHSRWFGALPVLAEAIRLEANNSDSDKRTGIFASEKKKKQPRYRHTRNVRQAADRWMFHDAMCARSASVWCREEGLSFVWNHEQKVFVTSLHQGLPIPWIRRRQREGSLTL